MTRKGGSYDGLQKAVRRMKMPRIEAWRNRYPDRDYVVRIETDEFTCICPKTGLPDFARLKLEYIPDALCAELKSLKLYLVHYRDIGIFHEHVVNRILDDFVKACGPREAHLEMEFKLRGGIRTTVRSDYKR